MGGRELVYERKGKDIYRKEGKSKLFLDKFKGRLMAGGVSLLLVGGAAGCSGCNKPSKEYMQKIEEQKNIELSFEEQKRLDFELVEVVLRTGGKGIGIIEAYLERGADPNAIDGLGRGPAIVRIARIGNLETLELVLENGGDADARDVKGETPLMESASSSHDSVKKVELLLKKGAEVDAKNNDGETALMRAAFDGNTGVMETLMEAGADVNAKDNEGNSVLMIACNPFGSEEAMELLMEKGADVDAKNDSGVSVLDHYNEYCNDVVELLEQHGAKE